MFCKYFEAVNLFAIFPLEDKQKNEKILFLFKPISILLDFNSTEIGLIHLLISFNKREKKSNERCSCCIVVTFHFHYVFQSILCDNLSRQ